jgi:galactosylceramidase
MRLKINFIKFSYPEMTLSSILCFMILNLFVTSTHSQTINIDGTAGGKRFDGIGAVSGGGATSVLLKDYPESQRSQILDLLFKPNFGASISALLVEVPGDGNSTQGSEPSHMHSRDDLNYSRGYEWWLMSEARNRNPNITLDANAWGCPKWVGENNFWSQDMCDYYASWIKGLKSVYGLDLDAIGCRNEKGVNKDFVKMFRSTLNKNGLSRVKIHAFDNWGDKKFEWCSDMRTDSVLRSAVDIMSAHTMNELPTPTDAIKLSDELGKPIWNSEEHIYLKGYDCEISMVESFNKNYIESGATMIVNWFLAASTYSIEPFPEDPAIIVAREPWSGNYYAREVLWGYAHYGQFCQPGWQYLNGACGKLTGGGTYVTLKSQGTDYSIIIETKDAKANQKISFKVGNGMSSGKLCVWRSNAQEQFVKLQNITPVNSTFDITLEPQSIYSISTTTGQQKGSFTDIPASKPFPFPYYETFEEYKDAKEWGYLPHYTADIAGIFEIANRPDKKGKCLRQVIKAGAQSWAPEWMPYTILGDSNWKDYEVSADVNFNIEGWAGIIGRVIATGTGYGCKPSGYYMTISDDGTCSLYVSKQDEKIEMGNLLATGKAANIDANKWHNIKLSFSDSTITGFVDKIQILSVINSAFSKGMVGLVAGSNNKTSNIALFDNLIVKVVNGPTPKPTEFSKNVTPIYGSVDSLSFTNPREIIPFDECWRFWLGDDQAAKEPNFDDTRWRTLNVPHNWSIEGAVNPPPAGENNGGYFNHGIGWYRKSFTFPADTTKKVVIEFDAVYMNSEVWINGQFLGRRPYGFIGFRYDITEYLKKDSSPNVLAVRVDDSSEPSLRWYAGSGIYRHVRLITTSYTHFRLDGGIKITTPEVSPEQAVVKADYIIDPHFFSAEEQQDWAKDVWKAKPQSREITLRSSVQTPDGKIVARTESKLAFQSMHSGQLATQMITVPKPRLWFDKTPDLYQLRSTLILDGRTLDETITTFGIRKLEFDQDSGLFVNGKSTKLKGVCLHQDAGSFGNAVPTAIWAYRLGLLKEMGCNAIRTSHHPFAPEFYDLCDQLGFYVFDEAFDEWTRDWSYNFAENPRGKSKFGYHLYFNQWCETDLRDMLRRDRNHPSVILYSIGNEVPDQFNDDSWKLAKKLIAICHEEDPTRLATSACDQSYVSSRNGFMDQLDIAGYNYIDRLYGDSTYVPEHRRFPHRLFMGTETSGQIHYWLGVRDNDYVIGDFIWTGIDYLGETGRLPSRGNNSGFLDLAGGKKPSFYQRAAYWRNDPVLQLFVLTDEKPKHAWYSTPALLKWNWSAKTNVTVKAATNCDEVELFLNNSSLGRKAVSHDVYSRDWNVGYNPGELKAIGYIKGRQVVTSNLLTTGIATKLQIKPLPLHITSDLILFEIIVSDKNGLNVIDASYPITVKVEGEGQLIGLDNGELDFAGPYKTDTRNAYQGRLLVTIQRTSLAGKIHITATAPGLTTAILQAR